VRAARFVLGGLAGLLILILGAAWLLPSVLDWNRYRTSFEALASSALGQPVAIEGPITLTLLPHPVLTASRVSVGATSELRDGSYIAVDSLRLRVAL
jgi:uncharacterized protein involved in outer membrane biogenesis